MLGDYGVVWFEEALVPDDVEGFRQLRAASSMLIATGEVLTRRQAFQPFIASRAVDVIQPDLTKCGGLSEGLRLEHGRRRHRRLGALGCHAGGSLGRISDRRAVHRRISRCRDSSSTREDCCACRWGPAWGSN
jgi:L-alanine-DL-glutamate epimerase-like enolase superfamily enzyme